jgi:hypothetical protein
MCPYHGNPIVLFRPISPFAVGFFCPDVMPRYGSSVVSDRTMSTTKEWLAITLR